MTSKYREEITRNLWRRAGAYLKKNEEKINIRARNKKGCVVGFHTTILRRRLMEKMKKKGCPLCRLKRDKQIVKYSSQNNGNTTTFKLMLLVVYTCARNKKWRERKKGEKRGSWWNYPIKSAVNLSSLRRRCSFYGWQEQASFFLCWWFVCVHITQ